MTKKKSCKTFRYSSRDIKGRPRSRTVRLRIILTFHIALIYYTQDFRVYEGTRDQPMPGPFPAPPIFLREKPWGRGCHQKRIPNSVRKLKENGVNVSQVLYIFFSLIFWALRFFRLLLTIKRYNNNWWSFWPGGGGLRIWNGWGCSSSRLGV